MVMQLTPKASLHLPRLAELVRVEPLAQNEKVFEFKLKDGKDLGHKPGQFVEISLFGIGEAPISISSCKGATVGIRGPFGNGFPVDKFKNKDVLIVAGGIGLFPLRSLISYLRDNRADFGRLIVLFGCRAPVERLFCDELCQWGDCTDMEFLETVDTCDDSWTGNVGVITTLFPKISFEASKTYAVVVGPPVMYRFVIAECVKKGIPEDQIILSLERRMKCGVGKCGHCQINNVYVCQEGPVFTYAELKKLKEAV